MVVRNPRIDAYIADAAPFAQPILIHLRALVHASCSEVEETIKWGFPHFIYHGAILCSMAAFKQHAAFGFWKAAMLGKLAENTSDAMGQFGRITALDNLPADEALAHAILEAMKLVDHGVTVPARPRKPKPEAPVPPALAAALRMHVKAYAMFMRLTPGQRREYCEWIGEAKRVETRARRVADAVAWLAEGKQRNWKYQ